MKLVIAHVGHEAFDPTRALLERRFPSLRISEVKGSGRQKRITEQYRTATLTTYLRPNANIECVVADAHSDLIVDTVLRRVRAANVRDGKVFVLPVEEACRIHTGEAGEHARQAHPGGDFGA